jgi:DNA-binding HxlR family transcriptional regulator
MKCCKKRSLCGVSSALDIIGDKWSLLIIRDILFHDKHAYSDFLNSEEKIATNILADRLQLLETNGIILKENHPQNKTKVFYKITPKGFDLMPILLEMLVWSGKYLQVSEKVERIVEEIKKDKEKIIRGYKDKHL